MGKFIAGFFQNPTFKNKSIFLSISYLPNILVPENPDFSKFPTGSREKRSSESSMIKAYRSVSRKIKSSGISLYFSRDIAGPREIAIPAAASWRAVSGLPRNP